jgi:hypothetical protein
MAHSFVWAVVAYSCVSSGESEAPGWTGERKPFSTGPKKTVNWTSPVVMFDI